MYTAITSSLRVYWTTGQASNAALNSSSPTSVFTAISVPDRATKSVKNPVLSFLLLLCLHTPQATGQFVFTISFSHLSFFTHLLHNFFFLLHPGFKQNLTVTSMQSNLVGGLD